MKTFILYVFVAAQQCAPQWVPNGEFYSKPACDAAARQIGAQNNPSHFKCVKK